MKTLLLLAALVLSATPMRAQRIAESRVAFAPSADTLHDHRARLAITRAFWGTVFEVVVGVPAMFLVLRSTLDVYDCTGICVASPFIAAGVIVVGAAAGAAMIEGSQTCSVGRRHIRALGGAFLGGAVGAGAAAAIDGHKDAAAVATVAFALLGAPVGATWALWKCD